MLELLNEHLGQYGHQFSWTHPQAGFFTVFSFHNPDVTTDDTFVSRLVSEYGVVAIPMYSFYPQDAVARAGCSAAGSTLLRRTCDGCYLGGGRIHGR